MSAFRAPGRVNLIGEHTDYSEGFVLPMAIDREVVVRATASRDGGVHVGDVDRRWTDAVVAALAKRGRPPVGIEGTLSSTVPIGAGLSSSAALEVALALALCDAADFLLPPLELALACQEAEQRATGVPSGIMDQLASIAGREGCALLIDCRSLEVEPVPLPPNLAVLVVDSGVRRELGGTAYAERRRATEAAAARLGLRSLRDAEPDQVADDPRARHVVSENARVLEAVAALRAGDGEHAGALVSASHASLRDDFEVSTPELDVLVAALEDAGALGARLTGAGFGGSVVALGHAGDAERILAAVDQAGWICRAVDGAGRLE